MNLVKYIDRSRFEPVVVFPYEGPLKKEIEDLGIKTVISGIERWIRYPFESKIENTDLRSRVRSIMEIIDRESPSVVHTNTSVVLEGAVASRVRNIPHIWHINETLDGHPELTPCMPLPFVYWVMSALSDRIVTPADTLKKQFFPVVDPSKLFTIYNGIDDKDYLTPGAISVRSEFGLSEKEIVAVTVAAVTERKGYPALLKAASLLKRKSPGIKFLWVGAASPEALADFTAMTKEFGLEGSVILAGFRRDFTRFIIASDILVHPSINEAFPMVILDAMAAGKPVIATDCGGVRESVADGDTGFMVPVNDPESLAEKIRLLAGDDRKRRSMGESGFRRFAENFSAKVYAKKFEELYTRITGAAKGAPLSERENALLDAFFSTYQRLSDQHWNEIEKERQRPWSRVSGIVRLGLDFFKK